MALFSKAYPFTIVFNYTSLPSYTGLFKSSRLEQSAVGLYYWATSFALGGPFCFHKMNPNLSSEQNFSWGLRSRVAHGGVQIIRCSPEIVKAENKIIKEKAISTLILPLRIWEFVFVGLGENSFHLCEPTCRLKCYSPRTLPMEMKTSRWSFIS